MKPKAEQEVHAILWLQKSADLSTQQIISLWRSFDSLVEACQASEQRLGQLLPEEPLLRLLNRRHQSDPFEWAAPESSGDVTLLPITSNSYPLLLKELYCPPPLLYVKGDTDLLSMPQLAMVGSRRATPVGGENAKAFARELCRCGLVVTSGLALGIDAMAHRGALEAGKTIAVLGTGVENIYPRRHQQLAREILDSGGVLVSEMPADTEALPSYFPQRNRIVSGLSLGVLVVEAAKKSGSLITARLAMEQGREVFAIPGSIHNPVSQGCHKIIREGATLVETVEDIANELGGMMAFKSEELGDASIQGGKGDILELLGFEFTDFDQLVARSGLPTPELTTLLLDLELDGWLQKIGNGYQRVR